MATTIRVYMDGGASPIASGLMALDRSFSISAAGVPDGAHTFTISAQEDGKAESPKTPVLTPGGSTQIVVSRAGLAVAVTGTCTVSAQLTVPKPLAAEVSGACSVAADLTSAQTQHPLAAAVSGAATVAADLTAPGASATVSDDFNRADGGLGANWTTISGDSAPRILSNLAAGAVGAAGTAYYDAPAFADNQSAKMQIAVHAAEENDIVALVLRHHASDRTRYVGGYTRALDGEEVLIYKPRIWRFVAGTMTVVASGSDVASPPAWIQFSASGTTLTVGFGSTENGTYTTRVSTDVATWQGSNPGVLVSGSPGVYLNSAAARVDNWSATG